jgi:hypothetical protein
MGAIALLFEPAFGPRSVRLGREPFRVRAI